MARCLEQCRLRAGHTDTSDPLSFQIDPKSVSSSAVCWLFRTWAVTATLLSAKACLGQCKEQMGYVCMICKSCLTTVGVRLLLSAPRHCRIESLLRHCWHKYGRKGAYSIILPSRRSNAGWHGSGEDSAIRRENSCGQVASFQCR